MVHLFWRIIWWYEKTYVFILSRYFICKHLSRTGSCTSETGVGGRSEREKKKAFHSIIYYNLHETADIFNCLCPSPWPVSDGKERNHLICMRNIWKDVHQIVSILIFGHRVGIWKILNFLIIPLLIIYYFYNKHILVLQSGATGWIVSP